MKWTRKISRITAIGLLLFTTACDWQGGPNELPAEENAPSSAEELEQQHSEYAETRLDKVENRVDDLMQTVRTRSDSLEKWIDTTNIRGKARLRSERLQQDLDRLQDDLQASLGSLRTAHEGNSEALSRELRHELERTEDELDQIQEEISEWYDNNVK